MSPRPAPPAFLLVEDEAIVAKDLTESLAEMGYDVFAIADSADEALEAAAIRRLFHARNRSSACVASAGKT